MAPRGRLLLSAICVVVIATIGPMGVAAAPTSHPAAASVAQAAPRTAVTTESAQREFAECAPTDAPFIHRSASESDGVWLNAAPASKNCAPTERVRGERHETGAPATKPNSITGPSIMGIVTGPGATGLVGIDVYACAYYCYHAVTGAGGAYSVTVPPLESYTVEFDDYSGTYAGGWYGTAGITTDWKAVSTVRVASSDVSGINVTLMAAVHITGTVTNVAHAGLPNINVYACIDTGFCYFATTAGDGTYSIGVAPNKGYRIEFDDYSRTYASGYYNNGSLGYDYGSASMVSVASGDVSGINIALPAMVHIAGTVTNTSTAPLAGIVAYACASFCYNTSTDVNGNYSVAVRPNDSYVLEFDDPSGTYAGGYYSTGGFTTSGNAATVISVASSDLSGKNITLPAAVHITGTVTNVVAAGLPNIQVYACISGGFCYYTLTAANGTYSVGVAANRSYTIQFYDNSGTYANGYYSTGGFTKDWSAASAVGVGSGDLSGINVTIPLTGNTYIAVNPSRILDSRNGTGLNGAFGSHVARTVQVTGAAVTPSATTSGGASFIPGNATAVTGNLTVTQQTSGGFLFIGPVPMNNPTSSTLNFPLGDDRANAVTVALGPGGTLSITYAAPTLSPTAQVIFDVTGYFMPDSSGATYVPLTPARILDTRINSGLTGASSSHLARTFQVTNFGGVAADATAVTGNLTVTQQTSGGFLFIGPIPMNNPTSSTLNFPLGDDRANAVTVALGPGGTLSITYAAGTLGPTAQVIFDVTGYFTPGKMGSTYFPLSPARLLDTRSNFGLTGASSSHVGRPFQVANLGGVAANATAVTGNLTVTQQASDGFLFIGPVPMNNPTSSTLNFPRGDDRANAVTVALGPGGTLGVTYAAGTLGPTAHVIFDVTGYFTP